MRTAIRAAQAIAAIAAGCGLLLIGHRWDLRTTSIALIVVGGVAALLGFAPPLIVALLMPRIREEVRVAAAIETRQILIEMRAQYSATEALTATELDLIRREVRNALREARNEGQADGILRERLGRVAGDPAPSPRRGRRPTDRLTDTGTHLRPVED